jgi:hypothetical protein
MHATIQKPIEEIVGYTRPGEADGTYSCHSCFACSPTQNEAKEKAIAIKVANLRLAAIYREFEHYGIRCRPCYFS